MISPNIELAMSFKIRPSSIGSIMAYPNQRSVPKGAMTYLREWLNAQTIAPPIPKTNKYCEKGTRGQERAGEMIQSLLNMELCAFQKGKILTDDFRISEGYDYITPAGDHVYEIKCSWEAKNFPKYDDVCPEKDYQWQVAAGYCPLTSSKKGTIAYVLLDATETEIEREVRQYCWKTDQEETEEIWDRFRSCMTYPKLSLKERVRFFTTDYDQLKDQQLQLRVKDCRSQLIKILNKHTHEQSNFIR